MAGDGEKTESPATIILANTPPFDRGGLFKNWYSGTGMFVYRAGINYYNFMHR
jgi:hypothetical protein